VCRLITEPLDYDFSGNVAVLQKPRNKESEVYDFVISEAEAIKGLLSARVSMINQGQPRKVLH
jgi:hypothetical protein